MDWGQVVLQLEVKMLIRGMLGGSNPQPEDHLDQRNQRCERIDMRGRSLGKGEEERENVKSLVRNLMIGQEIVIAEKIGTTGTVTVTGREMEREIVAVIVTVVAITVIETGNVIVTVTVVIALVRGIEKGIGKGSMKLTGTVAVPMIGKQTMIVLNQSKTGIGMQEGSETMIMLKLRMIKDITDIRSMGMGMWRLTESTSTTINMSIMERGAMTTPATVVATVIMLRMLITMIRWMRTAIIMIGVPVEIAIGSKVGEYICRINRMCFSPLVTLNSLDCFIVH